jgi:hypothetical protein
MVSIIHVPLIIVLAEPAPMRDTLLVMLNPDHVHVPAGTITVSPFCALLTALCTAAEEQDVAVIVLPPPPPPLCVVALAMVE